jgi:hypothetical protein
MDVTNNPGLLVGVLGVGVFQVVGLYIAGAPSFADLRENTDDVKNREALLDTDIVVGGATIVVASVAAWDTRSVWPFMLLLGGFAVVSFWHHLVLNTPSTRERR